MRSNHPFCCFVSTLPDNFWHFDPMAVAFPAQVRDNVYSASIPAIQDSYQSLSEG